MSSSPSSCSPSPAAPALHHRHRRPHSTSTITSLSPTSFKASAATAAAHRPSSYASSSTVSPSYASSSTVSPSSVAPSASSAAAAAAAAVALIRASPSLNSRKRGSPYCPSEAETCHPPPLTPTPPPPPPPPLVPPPPRPPSQQSRPSSSLRRDPRSRSSSSAASSTPTTTVGSGSASRKTTPQIPPHRQQDAASVSSPKRSKPVVGVKTLPKLYQNTSTIDLVILIADMLGELVGLNDRIPLSGAGLTRFHSRAPPTISIADYLNRLSVHASLQPSILLSMVYYIDILSTHYPPFVVSSLTVHRFLITAATVASKGLCDAFLTNSLYARVGGLSLMELNMLEVEFLVRVGWRIVPKAEVLDDYYRSLVMRMGGRYRVEDDEGG